MQTRNFGPSGPPVSEIGLGTWQLGGAEWGDVDEAQALAVLSAAADAGVSFIDTADIYGLGRSESLIGQFLKAAGDRDRFFIATKLGRHPEPGWPQNFEPDTICRHTEASLARLGLNVLDLTQTHCIPPEVMATDQVWAGLRRLQSEGLIRHFGASVESMDEALACLEVEGLASLQIIFNIFRRKPLEVLFDKAQARGVALIVRLPLASGLLAGKFTRDSTFPESDHRHFNRDGQCFNVGETFAGLPFETGVALADQVKPLVPGGMSMAQFAMRWCLDFDAVTTVIPGARSPKQASANAGASDLPSLGAELHAQLEQMYCDDVKDLIRGRY